MHTSTKSVIRMTQNFVDSVMKKVNFSCSVMYLMNTDTAIITKYNYYFFLLSLMFSVENAL